MNESRFESSAAADSRSRAREAAAYLMEVSVVFVFKRSAMMRPPSTHSSLAFKL